MTIKVEEKAKYLLFVVVNTMPNILIKHTKKDDGSENTNSGNTALIVIIIVVVLLLLVGVAVAIYFMRRRKRIKNSEIENVSSLY